MSAPAIIQRLATYCRKNGLRATVGRVSLGLKRASLASRMVLFYCDLDFTTALKTVQVAKLTVERKEAEKGVDPGDLSQIMNFWNPEILRKRIPERFQKG